MIVVPTAGTFEQQKQTMINVGIRGRPARSVEQFTTDYAAFTA